MPFVACELRRVSARDETGAETSQVFCLKLLVEGSLMDSFFLFSFFYRMLFIITFVCLNLLL